MKTEIGVKTRLGRIAYLNTVPFYHGLDFSGKDVEVYESFPSKVNLAMRRSQIDMAPVSSLEYLNHQDKYYVLPDLSIAARDFSGSVILFSKKKIEDLNGAKIALTRHSLSSAILLRILLRFKYHFKNKYTSSTEPVSLLDDHDAALVIGDNALFMKPASDLYRYDLSSQWWEWTHKPFCFALWAVRREFADAHSEETRSIWRHLVETRSRNLSDIEGLLKSSMQISFMDDKFSKLYGYYFNLCYDLDQPIMEGLKLFYQLAHRLGVSPKLKEVSFINTGTVTGA